MPKHTRKPAMGKVQIYKTKLHIRKASQLGANPSLCDKNHSSEWHIERGIRYGNNRRMWAAAKVKGRKRRRQIDKANTNQAISEDL